MKIAFCTLGCKVNQYETYSIMQDFIKNGYEIVDFDSFADIYVINTCTVTNMSDRKSRQMIRKVKKINPNSIIAAIGCYVQVAKAELQKVENIDIILGTTDKRNLLDYVEELTKSRNNNIVQISDVMKQRRYEEYESTITLAKTRAEIKVQDGCDRFCTYCIIPYARGPVRSRRIENVIQEIQEIASKGIKEVVITGIHIASYGKDFKDENVKLIDLLEKINEIDKIERIRLGSLEPTLITEEFVLRLKKLSKICNHFHLSLQSGCNETLKRMNRRYTTEQFKESVRLLRENFENVALTTDIIVGFPGETEEEFNITYEFLKKIKFYKMHIFKYSRRKGTKADLMKNQVNSEIQNERSSILIELSNKNELEYNNKYIGKTMGVLIEEKNGDYIYGHTQNYLLIKVKSNQIEQYHNKIVMVKLMKAYGEEIIGTM